MTQHDWGIYLQVATAIILLLTVYPNYYTWRKTRQLHSQDECERLFMELDKTILNDSRFYDLVAIDTSRKQQKDWEKIPADEKRLWLYREMLHNRFSFVSVNYQQKLISKQYWNKYFESI